MFCELRIVPPMLLMSVLYCLIMVSCFVLYHAVLVNQIATSRANAVGYSGIRSIAMAAFVYFDLLFWGI